MTGRAAGRLQGDDLVGEILRNMEEGLFRIGRKTIVPAIFRVYLHPRDFEPFRDVAPFIAGEIRAALDERLARWNGSKLKLAQKVLGRIGAGGAIDATEYVRVADAWTVDIYPDADGKLEPGEIEVCSELGSPQKTEYGAGSLTRRIFPKGKEPAGAPPEAPPEMAPAEVAPDRASEPAAAAATQPPPAASAIASEPEESFDTGRTKGRAFAYIRYTSEKGEQTFEVTKNQMVIGRGGRSYWVDLRLETLPDVSREHCRIRRDPETNRFTIEDVSQFGTAVDGKPVGQNVSVELPRRATISLAGVVDLRWEAA